MAGTAISGCFRVIAFLAFCINSVMTCRTTAGNTSMVHACTTKASEVFMALITADCCWQMICRFTFGCRTVVTIRTSTGSYTSMVKSCTAKAGK